MTKLFVELQDEDGTIYYLHTDGRVVFCSDGESVESKLNKKVNAADIINNCTSTATNKPLAAAQGKSLWERITSVITSLSNHQSSADHDGRYYTETEVNTKLDTKITASGGDAADAKVSGFTANNTSFPVPSANQTFRVLWGIMAKFCNDVKSSCFLISNIVNNCTSTATNKALSAAQGKALWDKYTQLNSDFSFIEKSDFGCFKMKGKKLIYGTYIAKNVPIKNPYETLFWANVRLNLPSDFAIQGFYACNITPLCSTGLFFCSITNCQPTFIDLFIAAPEIITKDISLNLMALAW